jgi:ferredoxin-nitrite reductase
MSHFSPEDTPCQVLERVRELAPLGWEEVVRREGALAVAKLRLVGAYDDRQDGFFMLRLRLPGGRLTWEQAVVIGEIARQYAGKPSPSWEGPDRFIELTTRQDIQLHWLRFEALPEVWQRLEHAGLVTLQACGDTARNVTSCPVAGIDPREVLDVSPIVQEVNQYVLDHPHVTAFLPRKFKIAITGCPTDCVFARIQDLAFTPAERDGTLGFHVWVGGGLSDYPRLASPLDLFVPPDHVLDVVLATLCLYGELGDYTHKAVNRFRALVHALGPGHVQEELQARLPARLPPAGRDCSTWQACDHMGVYPQRQDGRYYVGLCVPVGRLSGDELIDVAQLARAFGDGELRITQRQNVILTGVPAGRLQALLEQPLLQRYSPTPHPSERAVVACTSAPFCKFGIFNVKAKGTELIQFLRANLSPRAQARLDRLRLHMSGCKAACAQVHVGHVGLRATLGKSEETYFEAFDVAVGGAPGQGRLARWVALEVPVAVAFRGIGRLLESYAAEAREGEPLEGYLEQLPTERLAGFFEQVVPDGKEPVQRPASVSTEP